MDNVIAFAPRQRLPEPEPPAPRAGLTLRAHLEDAAQTALDAADKIIAALDHLGDSPASDVDRSGIACRCAVPPASAGQVLTFNRAEFETDATGVAVADEGVTAAAIPAVTPDERATPAPLRWAGHGNVIAAAGVALLELVGG